MLIYAITAITLALVFYTVGVWSEKFAGSLKTRHLVMFWIGFTFDSTGTALMGKLAGDEFSASFHSVTGLAAIFLMAVHAVWATNTLIKNEEAGKRKFHKFSVLVWLIWLIPYLSGMIYGMAG